MAIQTARRCEGINAYGQKCTRQLPPQDGPGRARRFCGDTCRSAARRNREYRALTRLPRCSMPHCGKRATARLTVNYHVETCQDHMEDWHTLAILMGQAVTAIESYDIEGLKRAELLRDEKHRMGIELQGQVTVDELVDEDVDEDEALELVDATNTAMRDAQRQQLYGNTGNVAIVHKSSRCRARHHGECDGSRKGPRGATELCLCTCH